VQTQRRRGGSKAPDGGNSTVPPQVPLNRLRTPEGETVDLYYQQKELFVRSYTRAMKQSRSVKAKKQTDYQVEKRKQQSSRDKAAMAAGLLKEAEDEGIDDEPA